MANKSEAKIKFSAETSELNEEMRKVESGLRTCRSELKLNQTQMKGNADNVDLLAERNRLLSAELEKTKQKVELANTKYEKAVEIYGENSREAEALKRQLFEVKNQEAAVCNEIQATNQRMEEQKRSGSGLRSEINQLDETLSGYDRELELNQKKLEGTEYQAKLLKERMKLLKAEYDENAAKAGALTEAMEECGKETGEASDEYKNLQQELHEAKIKQIELTNELKETKDEYHETETRLKSFAAALDNVGDKIQGAGKKMSVISAGVVGAGVSIGTMAGKFEDSMAGINTLLDDTKNLEMYEETIKRVSNSTGKSLEDMSGGMYQAISSLGDQGEETSEIFEVMAESAKAGSADTSDSVALISSGMKGYNDVSKETAQKISDLAFQTAKLGVTTFPEMAKSMQPLFPLASSLNMSYEELFGSMATLTGVTGNTSEVSTQLKAVFSNLLKPTETMAEMIEKYGYSNGAAMLEAEGMSGVLKILQDETGGEADQLALLFSSTEALTAMTALTGSQFDTFNDKLGQMGSAAGATGEALEKVSSTKFDKARVKVNELKNTGEELGETLLETLEPAFEGVSAAISGFTEWFSGLDQGQRENIITIAGVVAAIGPLLIIVGKMASGISAVIKVFSALNLVMSLNPVTLIVIAIAALVAGFVVLWNKCEGFRNFWKNLWSGITEAFDSAKNFIGNGIEAVGNFFTGMKENAEKNYQLLDEITDGKLSEVVEHTKGRLTSMKTAYEEAGGGINGAVAAATDFIKGNWKDTYNVIDKLTGGKLTGFVETTKKFLGNAKAAYDDAGGGIRGIMNVAYTNVNTLTGGKLGEMLQLSKDNLSSMKNAYEEAGGGIKGIVAATTEGVRGTWETGYNLVNELTGGKLEELKGKFTEKLEMIKTLVSNAVQKFKDLFDFDWKLPKIKMPHFKISGEFRLNPPSVPSFGLEWYAKGAILSAPTIFGVNGNSLMVGGEAGREAVLPISLLEEYINNSMMSFISAIPQIDYGRMGAAVADAVAKQPTKIYFREREVARMMH